jgi:UDP-2-acetamido-3-amino-2,3-dideoxy-glucuronate N-acetyltransferase
MCSFPIAPACTRPHTWAGAPGCGQRRRSAKAPSWAPTASWERAFIDAGVRIGSRCKIQNSALLYAPAVLEDGVFIGPGVILANDRYPRAITAQGERARAGDWIPEGVVVRYGASLGAGAVVVAGVEIGAWGLVAAGAVVSRPVPAHALVAGVPAQQIGWVGRSGRRLTEARDGTLVDPLSGEKFRVVEGTLENLT